MIRLGAALLVMLLGAGCVDGVSPNRPVEISEPPTLTVTGLITEIEFETLSLRAEDGRSLLFDLSNSPVPISHLREHMDQRLPVTIVYKAKGGRLIPSEIEDAKSEPARDATNG